MSGSSPGPLERFPSSRTVIANIRWGITWGLVLAAFFSVIVGGQFVFMGPSVVSSRGMSLGTAITAYFVGCVGGGVIIGLLRPLTRRRAGALVVGVAASVPLSIASLAALQGSPQHWEEGALPFFVIVGMLLGGAWAYQWWEEPT